MDELQLAEEKEIVGSKLEVECLRELLKVSSKNRVLIGCILMSNKVAPAPAGFIASSKDADMQDNDTVRAILFY